MRSQTVATRAALQRTTTVARALVWIRAVDRQTGAEAPLGLWNGDDHQDFEIEGETRTYYGVRNLLEIDPIVYQTGLSVRMQRLRLSSISPEVALLIRGYEPRHAPVEIHRALFDPTSRQLVDEPEQVFSGFVDSSPVKTPALGGEGSIELALASSARALTIPLSRTRSDETLRARAPGDGFRKYATVSGQVATKWGST